MKNTTVLSACMIVALAGTSASAQVRNWAAAVDGNWNLPSNWAANEIPDNSLEDASFGLFSPYLVSITNNYTLGTMFINNPDATITIGNNRTHTLNGWLINNGTLVVNSSASSFNTHLKFLSSTGIDGTGSILLNAGGDPADAQIISSGPTLWHSFGHTIHGSGQITGQMQNDGDIIADDPAGAGLRIAGNLPQTNNGRLIADGGKVFLGNGSLVASGEITSLNGGLVEVQNSATIMSLTNSGDIGIPGQGWSLYIDDLIENNGTIIVNSNNSTFNAHLRLNSATAVLNGTGNVSMISMGDLGDAQILTTGAFNGVIGADQTVEGSGLITGANGGAIFNHGTINANDPLVGLGLAGNHDGGGMYRSDDSRLILRNGLTFYNGTFDSSGTGIVETDHNGVSTLSNVINLGEMGIVGQGGTLALDGPLSNFGTITVNSNNNTFNAHIRFDGSTFIDGTGLVHMVSMGALDDAQIFTSPSSEGTIGFGQTVDGSGIIDGRSGGKIINNGFINANHAAVGKSPMIALELRGNHDGQTTGMYGSDNAILSLGNGLVLKDGSFNTSGTGIVDMTNNGIATLANITNLGQMGVRGQGGTIALTDMITNNGTITVNSNMGTFNAYIRMDNEFAAINGTGTVRMQIAGGIDDAQIYTLGEFSAAIGTGQTVAGSGIVDGRNLGTIVNNGTINGDDPAFTLDLRGNHNGSGGGVYRSDNGTLGLGNGLVLDGGTFDSSGTGMAEMTGGGVATLSNVTNLGEMGIRGQGSTIALTGPMINDGTFTINSNMATFNARIRYDADTTIDGTGTVRMQIMGDIGDALLYTGGPFLGTIGADQTVAGSGYIDGRSGGTIINNGTINGDDPAFMLRLNGSHDGSGGGMYRSDDGVLGLANGLIMTGGTFDSSGTGIVDMVDGGTATLSNMTNNGTMGIRGQGSIIGLAGPLTNNGLIKINSNMNIFNAHIRFLDATEINGIGTIDLYAVGDFGDAQILNDQGFIGTIGAGQTITGSGRLQGEMNMNGTLDPSSTFRRFDIDNLHLSATSVMIADLGGLLGNEFDRLLLAGADNIDLDGTLIIQIDSGYVPVFGDSWDIISGGSISGMFSAEDLPVAPFGQVYRVIYEPSRVYVVLTCDADLTGDNTLDFFDVSLFLNYFGAEDVRGDLTGDGAFNFFDISLFLSLFNGGGC